MQRESDAATIRGNELIVTRTRHIRTEAFETDPCQDDLVSPNGNGIRFALLDFPKFVSRQSSWSNWFFKQKYYITEESVSIYFEFLNGPVAGHYDLRNDIVIK